MIPTSITEAIQVSYPLADNTEREINGILEALNTYTLHSGVIPTFDTEEEIRKGKEKIPITPLWKGFHEEE